MTVDVLLKSTAGNEIYVLGEVGQPGSYPIRRPVSVLEALTLARGTNVKARLDSVVIMRRNGNQVIAHRYDVEKALVRRRPANRLPASGRHALRAKDQTGQRRRARPATG